MTPQDLLRVEAEHASPHYADAYLTAADQVDALVVAVKIAFGYVPTHTLGGLEDRNQIAAALDPFRAALTDKETQP